MRLSLTTLLLLAVIGLQAQVSCVDCPATFSDHGGYYLIVSDINISVDGDPDLAEFPLDEVWVTLYHDFLSDVFIALQSPAGDVYYLMADDNNQLGGCGSGPRGQMEFIFRTGSDMPVSTGGPYPYEHRGGIFTVTCPYEYPPTFLDDFLGITEVPTCDLDYYNAEGAPVSGTWRLIMACVCGGIGPEGPGSGGLLDWNLYFGGDMERIQQGNALCDRTYLINEWGHQVLDCANEGEIRYNKVFIPQIQMDAVGEFGEVMSYNPDFAQDVCAVIKADTIMDMVVGRRGDYEANMATIAPGEYRLKRFVHSLDDSEYLPSLIGKTVTELQSDTFPFCLGWAEGEWTFEVLPRTPVEVADTIAICPGDCTLYGGAQICEAGTYRLEVAPTSSEPCGQLVDLTVEIATMETELSYDGVAVACPGDSLVLHAQGATSYKWRQGSQLISEGDSLLISNISDLVGEEPIYVDFISREECIVNQTLQLSDSCRTESIDLFVDENTRICVEEWAPQGVSWCGAAEDDFSYTVAENCVVVNALSEGAATLCLHVFEGGQLLKRELSLKATVVTNQDELSNSSDLIFPNPARSSFYYQQSENQAVRLHLLTLKGQQLRTYQQHSLRAEHDLTGVPPGVYYVQRVDAQGSSMQRLVVL